MAEVVKMPKMSDTMTEGVLAKWHKKVGDKVKSGDVLAEIETDKATMDFESYQDGTILFLGVEEGQAVPVDAVIAVLGSQGEDYKAALLDDNNESTPKGEEKTAENTAVTTPETPPAKKESGKKTGQIVAAEKAPAATPAEEQKAPPTAQPVQKVDKASIPATVIRMPALSDTMTEGVINKWNFKVGDKVKSDDSLADVETDKATMEVVGYEAGTLLYIGVEEGKAAPVNGIIAIVGKEGTDITPLLNDDAADSGVTEQAPANEAAAPANEQSHDVVQSDESRIKASPLARKIAKDKGISLTELKGSADGGRIVKKDVEAFKGTTAPKPAEAQPVAAQPAAVAVSSPAAPSSAPTPAAAPKMVIPPYVGQEKYTEKPVSQMRKVIAKRLSESLFTAPHFYITMSIDMDQAVEARNKINAYAPSKVSFNDLVLKATAIALKQHPNVNSSWLGDKIRYNEHINIGVAVAIDEGLLVPVIRFADGKSLSHISAEVKDFAAKAKAKKLQPADWEGSTFTISNLGMFGVDEFTAIINPPDSCILAISGIQQIPVVKNGAVVPGNVMKVTLSCDHRVVDGATGAAFLQTLKALLEEPVRLLF